MSSKKLDSHRYIEPGWGEHSLSEHEVEELNRDFNLDTKGYHILIAVTKEEYNRIYWHRITHPVDT